MKKTKFTTTTALALAQKELARFFKIIEKNQVLRRRAPKIPRSRWTVDLEIVGAEKMKKLNRKYLKKNRPTDVLSFPSDSVFFDMGFFGSLLVCMPILRAQASEQGHGEKAELRVLLAHGVLHLLGFDHEKSRANGAKMAAMERKLLGRALGLIHRSK